MRNFSLILIKLIRGFYLHQRLLGACAVLFGVLFAFCVLVFFGASATKITYLIGYISLIAALFISLFSYLNRRQGLGVDIAEGWVLRGKIWSDFLSLIYAAMLLLFLGVVAAFSYFLVILVVLLI